MHELEVKRGRLSNFFRSLFLFYNFIMFTGFVMIFLGNSERSDSQLWVGAGYLFQNVWMPGAVILGMLAMVTNENRITVKRAEDL